MRFYEGLRRRFLSGGIRIQDPQPVVTRRQKLLSAGAVLGVGAALAWPLRRGELLPSTRLNVGASRAGEKAIVEVLVAAPHAAERVTNSAPTNAAGPPTADRDPFAGVAAPPAAGSAPTFSTVSSGTPAPPPALPVSPPRRHVHVVHEGDSLDRLAKRYLGDEARALEIFDLNRDVLDNPHVLRIGVELQIPVAEAGD